MLSGKTTLIFDAIFGFYSEEYFREMLVMERKRSERSRKPFLLAMIDIDQMRKAMRDSQFIKKLSNFMQASTREIDIKGWYERHSIMGIIFIECNTLGKDKIVNKLRANLEQVFGAEQANAITISCAAFPEEKNLSEKSLNESEKIVADPRFYPEPIDRIESKKISLIIKRGIDIAGSFAGILLLSPLFIVFPLLIKLSSKGPVFFIQKRVGQGGRLFPFIKFRSMRVDKNTSIHKEFVRNFIRSSDSNLKTGKPTVFKMKNDPRITPIGKFIRKTSIDELPQLFNVLWGDMSLVGPRPAIPYEIEEYDIWHKRRVCEVRPGITGFWQVKGRSKTTFEMMVKMDIEYIRKWSLLWDIVLLIQTPFALFKGAY